ncbi:16S rRNA (cytosine(967)-C(5))-methyltransferase RsmB [Motiliproteus sp. SC1-56]|uniref:16S rRNA (cytosine(967)-C(5))-methyltransferase RsmB n=1 Tax=Motiliproteus sp. SC1-56 TaxID=2799565 RepID=UPI001A8F2E5E
MSQRLQAARVLARVLKREASLASALPPVLARLEPAQRPLVQELCYGTCRFLPRLERLAKQLLKKPLKRKDQDVQALILLGLYQLDYMRVPAHAAIGETVQAALKLKKPWAKGLINGVLRSFQRDPQLAAALQADPVFHFAHPAWLIERLAGAWGEQHAAILEANNRQAPLTLRVNQQRSDRPSYLARLEQAGIKARPTPFAPEGLTLDEAQDVEQLPGFSEGGISVQDEAAQLAAGLLDLGPGQRVLDACAAPGGKTGHILESEGMLKACLALDVSEERLPRIEQNLDRLGLRADLKAADASDRAWWDGAPFDRILLDAPCSATGVIRRNPDIKYLRQADDIAPLAVLQGKLLDNLWPMLKPGGRLVYATCSVLPEENEKVVQAFLARHPQARECPVKAEWGMTRPVGRQLFPQPQGHDGFYYAVLEKPSGCTD